MYISEDVLMIGLKFFNKVSIYILYLYFGLDGPIIFSQITLFSRMYYLIIVCFVFFINFI